MGRKPVIVANWKMYMSHKGALETLSALKQLLKKEDIDSDIIICPSFPSLRDSLRKLARDTKIQLGGQGIHWEEKGSWTGAVSVLQIKPFVEWCIVGHSESRQLRQESDDQVRSQANLLLNHDITPIVCIGETASERMADQTKAKITQQVHSLFKEMPLTQVPKIVVTYEPIWAISANEPTELPDPGEIAAVMLLIRKLIAEKFGVETAERLRVLYGGSVTATNIASYMAEPGIDGVMVGSASLQPAKFVSIIKTVQQAGL